MDHKSGLNGIGSKGFPGADANRHSSVSAPSRSIIHACSRSPESNKALVRESFERWAHGTGSPFELLLADVEWTIVGSSPLSKTYHDVSSFMDERRLCRPFVEFTPMGM
jgi:hypothetical protein